MFIMKYTITIPEPCNEKWHLMSRTEKGRFCNSCEKEVIDFTKTSTYRMADLLDSHQQLCGRFTASQLNRAFSSNKNHKLHRTSLIFGITSLLTLCSPTHAQGQSTQTEQTISLGSVNVNQVESQNSIFPKTIQGIVLDQDNLPLPGANIVFEGTNQGTQTDFDGNFSLKVPEENNHSDQKVIISYIGFRTKSICLSTFKVDSKISLLLSEDVLGGIVVVRRKNIFRRIANLFKRKRLDELEEGICVLEEESEILENYQIEKNIEGVDTQTIDNMRQINFWPNPVKNELNVSYRMDYDGKFSVKLIPIKKNHAEIQLKDDFKSAGNYLENFRTDGIEQGIYVLQISTGTQIIKKKIIVQR